MNSAVSSESAPRSTSEAWSGTFSKLTESSSDTVILMDLYGRVGGEITGHGRGGETFFPGLVRLRFLRKRILCFRSHLGRSGRGYRGGAARAKQHEKPGGLDAGDSRIEGDCALGVFVLHGGSPLRCVDPMRTALLVAHREGLGYEVERESPHCCIAV
jgi:hypothetical protein